MAENKLYNNLPKQQKPSWTKEDHLRLSLMESEFNLDFLDGMSEEEIAELDRLTASLDQMP